jgi:DNA mismatch repair protein MutS
MIVTGPNASGKTTILKTTLINIIITQQFGFGFYESASLVPYDFLHSYLNIPDTSGRDSLFQAEARRCKEILNDIEHNSSVETHFCIFDELYSGTNPEDAISSANAFLKYLIKYKNVDFVLTTHFTELCQKLDKNTGIDNFHMKTDKKGDTFTYTYKLEKGISIVRGGVKVLGDMNYPKEILDSTRES